MTMDLNATGPKVVAGTGGGTGPSDALVQTVQVTQSNIGAIPVIDAVSEAALGTTGDVSWNGAGVASIVAALKAIALNQGADG